MPAGAFAAAMNGAADGSGTTSSTIILVVALIAVAVLIGVLIVNRRDRGRLADTTNQLAASEKRLREVAETVPAGIFQTDAHGRHIYANPWLTEITGDNLDAALGDHGWRTHPDDEQRVLAEWMRAARDQASFTSRFRIVRTDGSVRWIDVHARPVIDDTDNAFTGWIGSAVDVTEEAGSIAELRRFSEILEATPDLVVMVDTDGRFSYANAAARSRFGIRNDVAPGQLHAADVYAPSSRALFYNQMIPTANRLGVWSGEVDLLLDDGKQVPVTQVVVAHRRPDGSIDYYSAIARDMTEHRVLEEKLAYAGLYDSVTGLPNRNVLVEALGKAMAAADDGDKQIAVMLLDLDNFKLVNDSFGHESGDVMLRLVTQRLQGIVGPGDLLARFGSDVFCILASAIEGDEEALSYATHITEAMAVPFQLDSDQVFLSLSQGIALSGHADPLATPETLLRDADVALHRAKEKGRARTEIFVEDYRANAMNRLRTANDLHRALTEDEFRVVYQPEVELRTGHITSVEALVRWHHPERGLVPPSEFVPLAEQTGLIAGIGEWVLDNAVAQASEWKQARHDGDGLVVWVNLSARQLGDPGLVELVADVLRRHAVDTSQLGLEITESALLEDAEGAVTAMSSLRALGVRLAVDDFGTGYSSLSYLKRLPVDAVKVDRSFIDGLAIDGDDSAIVAAVTGMARALRLTTIAEGVENLDQLLALRRLGCDLAQGYFFTTPQPPAHISRLLESDQRSPMFAYEDPEGAAPGPRHAR